MKIYKFFWLPVLIFLILSGCGAHAGQPPVGDGICFLAEDGTPLTGWQDFEEGRFYLSSEGMAATGIRKIGEKTYLFSDSGVMQTGWTEYAGGRYYLRSDGSMVTGSPSVSRPAESLARRTRCPSPAASASASCGGCRSRDR